MIYLKALAVLVAVASVYAEVSNVHPLSAEHINIINQKATTWKAGKNFDVKDWERVKRIASGVLPKSSSENELFITNPHDEAEAVPESFDAREAWPKCESLKQIRDQSGCGSCWAFGAVTAMSDRICIHSNQTKQVYVSAEELTACCFGVFSCGFGCGGGRLPPSWSYWKKHGIVTGGLYNSSQGCQDYSLPPCEHHAEGDLPQCSSLKVDTPKCKSKCHDSTLDFKKSKTYGQAVHTFNKEKQIQLEIYKNGPVEASFTVYEDFPNYKTGVYKATSRKTLGGHAIKILGWGVENGTKYWLIANSWNEDWGDKGYFKILRGENHCHIESDVASSLPKL